MQTQNTGITKNFFAILCITDAEGKLLAEFSYGAWGRMRDPETWALNPAGFENPQGLALLNGRGYTGHEHLSEFGLINMNGRLYDPVLGRMLSPDNYIQLPDYTQNFNRYSYVLNNPLKYTDPSGEWIHIAIGALIGGIVNVATHWNQIDGDFGKGVDYFFVGALVGGVSAAVGGWTAGATQALGAIPGALVGAGVGTVTGGATSVLQGGLNNVVAGNDFWATWESDFKSGAISGAVSGAVGGGIRGYKNAKEIGANPWTGKKIYSSKYYGKSTWTIGREQPDPTKDCVYYTSEKMDNGYGNHSAAEFKKIYGGSDGADPSVLWKKMDYAKVSSYINPDANDMISIMSDLDNGSTTGIIAVIGDEQPGHAVELLGGTFESRARLYGGGKKIKLISVDYWNPIGNSYKLNQNPSFLKITALRLDKFDAIMGNWFR